MIRISFTYVVWGLLWGSSSSMNDTFLGRCCFMGSFPEFFVGVRQQIGIGEGLKGVGRNCSKLDDLLWICSKLGTRLWICSTLVVWLWICSKLEVWICSCSKLDANVIGVGSLEGSPLLSNVSGGGGNGGKPSKSFGILE